MRWQNVVMFLLHALFSPSVTGLSLAIGISHIPQGATLENDALEHSSPDNTRRSLMTGNAILAAALFTALGLPEEALAKSYSSNARNMERLNSGDASGGSVYDNNPKSSAARKRRAMTGCKVPSAREEAAESILKVSSLSEFDCNQKVMGGDPDFMLTALQKLDCPTCPYGIRQKR